jgi:uncharacterized repeat protein (TIGR01451 family)
MKVRSLAWVLAFAAATTACRGNRVNGGAAPAPYAPTQGGTAPCPPEPLARADLVPVAVVWDERVSPVVDCNPVYTQHTLVVTVIDQCGNPLPGQRVEWMLARTPTAVGDIVATDDQYGIGAIDPMQSGPAYAAPNNGNKIDNHFAVSVTNFEEEFIDAANNYPYVDSSGQRLPDIAVGRGQSWITITSVSEGVTDIVAYVPAVKDGAKHKVFAKKIWADFAVTPPADAVNLLPNDVHGFTVNVHRQSDHAGLPGQPVEAEVLDGPDATFDTGGRVATATTGPDGNATFMLRNVAQQSGTNRIRFTAKGRFHGQECPRTYIARKTWQKVALACNCQFSVSETNVNAPFDATFTVTNSGDAPAHDARLDVQLGAGLQTADGTTFPLNLGTIAPGQSVSRPVRLVATTEGTFTVSTNASSPQGNATSQCACTVTAVKGNLEIAKRCEPGQVSVGEQVRFVVTVSNTGRGSLSNVMLVDDYPDGITPNTANSVAVGDLAPGQSAVFEFLGTTTRPGRFLNTARATADGQPEKSASCEVVVVQCALTVGLICPGRIGFGEPGNFTVKVSNTGDGPATGCVVRLTHGPCLDGGVIDVPIGALAPGQSFTHDWVARGRANAKCSVVAEASCNGCQARDQCEVEVTGLPAIQTEMVDKDLQKNEKGIFVVGEELLYVLEVQNDVATESTPPLKIVLSLPAELQFVSATGTRGVTFTGGGQSATSTEFRLDVNEKIFVEFRVKAVAVPPGNLAKTLASVVRASDGVELASETESTTIK